METTCRARQKQSSVVQSSFHSSQVQSRSRRSKSLCQADQELLPPTASFAPALPPTGTLRRSLSGTLAQDRGHWQEEELPYQYAYKGPSHRTINRITNRQQQHYQQQGSSFLQEGWGGTGRVIPVAGNGWGGQWQQQQQQQQQHVSRSNQAQYQGPLYRAASLHSVRSVGKGVDVMDGASIHSNDPLDG